MLRLSKEAWDKLGEEMQTAYDEVTKAKERGEEIDYKKFNVLFYLDCRIRDAIEEGLQNIRETGWYD